MSIQKLTKKEAIPRSKLVTGFMIIIILEQGLGLEKLLNTTTTTTTVLLLPLEKDKKLLDQRNNESFCFQICAELLWGIVGAVLRRGS